MIEVGDTIVRKGGGPYWRVKSVEYGSWSGRRYYNCRSTDEGDRRLVCLSDDEVKLVKKRKKG